MAPPPGTRDDDGPTIGEAIGWLLRMIFFCLLAGASLAILAGVLLLPEYAKLQEARYELARQEAVNADLTSLTEANARLIAALPGNEVLAKRMAMNQYGLWPENELVVVNPSRPRLPPGLVYYQRHPRPSPPDGPLIAAAQRVSNVKTRRALWVAGTVAMIAAILLFVPRHTRRDAGPQEA